MTRIDLDSVRAVGGMFGKIIVAGESLRGVWRAVDSERGSYALKPFRRGASSLLLAARTHRTVEEHDPELLPELIVSKGGIPYAYYRGTPFIAMKWVDGRSLDFYRPGDRLRALKTILRWGEAARGMEVPSKLRLWRRWESILTERIDELRRCRQAALREASVFGRIYLSRWDFFYAQANRALEILAQEPCLSSSAEAEGRREICHSDWAHHNLIMRPGGGITVLDLEYLHGTAAVWDYADLLNRFLLLDRGRPDIIPVFIGWLRRLRPLHLEQREHLRALLHWPEAFWMAGRQAFIERLPFSERFAVEKFIRKVPAPDIWRAWQREIDHTIWDSSG